MHCVGFDPYYNNDSLVLILGSFPSVKSREVNFYYGNKQNRFWRLLAEIFNEDVPIGIEEKKNLLKRHRIALWDMVTECDIVGSMDKDIQNPVIADVENLIKRFSCALILCNGGKSYELFTKHFSTLPVKSIKLPSTSPANGRFSAKAWQDALLSVF